MKIYGLDFTSAPTSRKPITCASGVFTKAKGGKLSIQQIEKFAGFPEFEEFLARKGPWFAGIDFPFGQPWRLIRDLKLKPKWPDYVRSMAKWDKQTFEEKIKTYQNNRQTGSKEPLRITDSLAGAKSPLKLVNPPAGKMFFEGARRLYQAGVSILPCCSGKDNRIVVETYPALLARRFAGSYKSKRTEREKTARQDILKGLMSAKLAMEFGFRMELDRAVKTLVIDDPSGDMLDAALCAVQAAWSYSRGKPNYGIPDILHPILQAEGWIIDPALIRNGVNRAASEDRVLKPNPEAEDLRESEARAKAVKDFAPDDAIVSRAVESSAESIMITDPKGDIQIVNPAFTAITGYAADEVVGKNPRFLRSGKQPPKFFEDLWKTISSGQVWKGDIINRKKCGSLYHSELTISPILDETGKRYGFVGVSRDVTTKRESEKNILEANAQLAQARDKALEASRAKSRFLAIMSHELRTPLNAIIGYSDMLLGEVGERSAEDMAPDIQEIKEAGEQLLELINDTLDLCKMESGKMEIKLESFNISKLVQIVVNTVFPMVKKCNNTLEVNCPPKTGSMVADITRVRQMLLNLLSNACKFTEDGTITLKVTRKKRQGDKVDWVSFEIADSGIGMTPKQVDMLFEEFTQAHSSAYAGAGLGLFISRRFCRMMGGDISVKSELTQGSTFTIRLPVKVAPPREHSERRTTDPISF